MPSHKDNCKTVWANIRIIISSANNFGKISVIIFYHLYYPNNQQYRKYFPYVTAVFVNRTLQIAI